MPTFDNLHFFSLSVLKSYLGWYIAPSLRSFNPTEHQLGEAHYLPGLLLSTGSGLVGLKFSNDANSAGREPLGRKAFEFTRCDLLFYVLGDGL